MTRLPEVTQSTLVEITGLLGLDPDETRSITISPDKVTATLYSRPVEFDPTTGGIVSRTVEIPRRWEENPIPPA